MRLHICMSWCVSFRADIGLNIVHPIFQAELGKIYAAKYEGEWHRAKVVMFITKTRVSLCKHLVENIGVCVCVCVCLCLCLCVCVCVCVCVIVGMKY